MGVAELRFGDETEDANETNADVTAPISLVATTMSEARRAPPATAIDLTGGDKEWQPISTAPLEQNLEVRLEDFFGRYVLLFPCRLIPGQGWINGWHETPLPSRRKLILPHGAGLRRFLKSGALGDLS